VIDLKNIIIKAQEALEKDLPLDALAILEDQPDENYRELIFLKGEIYFKLQRWGDALNQFSLYRDQFPADKRAESYCLMIQNILGFYHKDLYNP